MNWIQKHSYTKKIPCGEDELFFDIMSRFVFALKHRSIEQFPSLAHILAYLRKCVHSVIMSTWRKNSFYADTLEIDCAGAYEDRVDEKITAGRGQGGIFGFTLLCPEPQAPASFTLFPGTE